MKKLLNWCAALLLVAAAAMLVTYRAVNRVPSEELPAAERVEVIFEDGGCLSCHSADPKLPFYAKLPVAGKIVMKDIDSGYRAYDMTKFMEDLRTGQQPGPVDLAKIDPSRLPENITEIKDIPSMSLPEPTPPVQQKATPFEIFSLLVKVAACVVMGVVAYFLYENFQTNYF